MTRIWTNLEDAEAHIVDKDWLRNLPPSGTPMRASWNIPTINVISPPQPPDVFRSGPIQVVSERVIDVLRQQGVSEAAFEALPVDVYAQAPRGGPYFVLNVLTELDAVDRVRSRFTLDNEGMIDAIERLVIAEDRAVGDIFWLDAWERVLCASDRLASALEQAQCTGVEFIRQEQWPP